MSGAVDDTRAGVGQSAVIVLDRPLPSNTRSSTHLALLPPASSTPTPPHSRGDVDHCNIALRSDRGHEARAIVCRARDLRETSGAQPVACDEIARFLPHESVGAVAQRAASGWFKNRSSHQRARRARVVGVLHPDGHARAHRRLHRDWVQHLRAGGRQHPTRHWHKCSPHDRVCSSNHCRALISLAALLLRSTCAPK